jgi:hypothetical protein
MLQELSRTRVQHAEGWPCGESAAHSWGVYASQRCAPVISVVTTPGGTTSCMCQMHRALSPQRTLQKARPLSSAYGTGP